MGHSIWGATAEDMKEFPGTFKREIDARVESIAQEKFEKITEQAVFEASLELKEKLEALEKQGVGLEITDELGVSSLLGNIGERVDWENMK